MNIFYYNIHRANRTNEPHAGVAIAMRKTIEARVVGNFNQEFLAVTLQTDLGPITIGTGYNPPRTGYLDTTD